MGSYTDPGTTRALPCVSPVIYITCKPGAITLTVRGLTFHLVDVFAESPYGGNELAVVRGASRLSTDEMQKIAREFNFSETTFITTSENPGTKAARLFKVRIFTPTRELPFAGHPTLGTAYVIQKFVIGKRVPDVTLDLKIGKIPVTLVYGRGGELDRLWMRQVEPTFEKERFSAKELSKVLGIRPDDIDPRFPIVEVSTGVPFIIVPLRNLDAVKRCRIDGKSYDELLRKMGEEGVLVFSPEAREAGDDLSVRVFVEAFGVPEDAATGSGNGCLAAYLSHYRYFRSKEVDAKVDQGHEIGRPSRIYLKAREERGRLRVSVGGRVASVGVGKFG
ncbi:MAG: PhzF family phenazine biosynthesis protein [Nitrososphaerales archaeon]|jgi:trans-2,3-dihydro-3-hydroxyanthranilate isomerase